MAWRRPGDKPLSEPMMVNLPTHICVTQPQWVNRVVNTLRLRQNASCFADNIFKCIFLNENVWILLKISLMVVSNVSINNIPALVQIMAWRRPGDTPLSEPMMVNLPTHGLNELTEWLTHWGWDKMPTVSQTTYSNAFSWMKMYEFRLRFHWCLFLTFQLILFQHWFR